MTASAARRAVRRFLGRLGDRERLAVAYKAGPRGYEFFRLLSRVGVACDVIGALARAGQGRDRVKSDRRDAKKFVRLYRAGELSFVCPALARARGAARAG